MSWSVPPFVMYPASAINDLEAGRGPEPPDGASIEVVTQLAAGVAAAVYAITTGALGDDPVIVNVRGHANPEHRRPSESWSADYLVVEVTSITREELAAREAAPAPPAMIVPDVAEPPDFRPAGTGAQRA